MLLIFFANVFVILGDGECNEGSVWEAAMAAPNLGLNNLYAIIDNNNFQQTGSNKEIMNVENLKDKWSSIYNSINTYFKLGGLPPPVQLFEQQSSQ